MFSFVKSIFRPVYLLFWKAVFFWKKRTGWIDLHETITITGEVIKLEQPDIDGDMSFNVKLDPGHEHYITGFGGRLTGEDGGPPAMHCEIPPWASDGLRAYFDTLKVGDRVCVVGAWGFDGVHTGRSMWLEVPLALIRHQSNVKDGWFEIHDVHYLQRLRTEVVEPKKFRRASKKKSTVKRRR